MYMRPLLLLLLLSALALLQAQPSQAGKVKCKPSPLELVFAIDVSSSLSRDDFQKLKKFLTSVASSLPISAKQTRPAAISFSTNVKVEVDLGQANSANEFKKGVEAIPYYRGFTATGQAMHKARTAVFTKSRVGASKLLVVVTDGRTNHPGSRLEALRLVQSESAALIDEGVRVHAVGIGGVWLKDELRAIASGEDFSMINDFKGLSKMVDEMVKDICDVHCTDVGKVTSQAGQCFNGTQRIRHIAKTHNKKLKRCEKAITYEYKYCGKSHLCKDIDTQIGDCVNGERAVVTTWEDFDVQKQRCVKKQSVKMLDCSAIEECKEPVADVMIVLDSSNSLKIKHWNEQVRFVHALASSMKISSSAIRIGVVVFGTTAWSDILLGSVPDKQRLLNQLQRLRRRGNQWTNTGLGIQYATNQFLTRGRPGVQRLAIIMTDGESNKGPNAVREAARMESQGVSIIVVGVGKNLKKVELQAIATPPLKDHLFYATDFNKLMAWASKISEETCESITPPDPSLCDLPPKRVISDCYRGIQKITEIRYNFDSAGRCTKKMVSRTLDKCMLLCSDPIDGNHYYEGESWESDCSSFVCRRPAKPTSPLLPKSQGCVAANGKCKKPSNEAIFKCHDEVGQLFGHCSCRAGTELSIVTADANA